MSKKRKGLLNKIIYIPLEIIDREIDGALLLSLEAVSRGWKVVIGSQRKITESIESNELGVYFLKSITPGQINLQKRIVNNGNLLFSQDAEGLLQRPGMEYKMRFCKNSLKLAKKVFFWGEKQKSDFIDVFGTEFEEKCEVTGSPRADHWELISQEREEKYIPKYILIATSFGNENHALGEEGQYNLSKDEAGIKNGSNSLEEFNKYFNDTYQLGMFLIPYYKKLVIELSKNFPEEKIILRPHPSESLQMWQELIKVLDNVEIRTDGSIIDWLSESKVLIQYGSTCAIQSNILNIPTVTLVPELPKSIKSYDLEDSRRASTVFTNLNDLVTNFREFLSNGSYLSPIDKNYIDKLIFERNKINSSEKIMDAIEKIYKNIKITKKFKDGTHFKYKFGRFKQNILLIASLLPFWQKLAPKKYRHLSLKSFLYYKKRKQPSLSLYDFKERLKVIKKLSSFQNDIRVKVYKKDVFLLDLV